MDAEEYYESRRLDEEAKADRFDSLKEGNIALISREIQREFESGFSGRSAARLPQSHIGIGGDARVCFSLPIANAIADVCDKESVMALLIEASNPECTTPGDTLARFREACIQAYIDEYADDLAEIITHAHIEQE